MVSNEPSSSARSIPDLHRRTIRAGAAIKQGILEQARQNMVDPVETVKAFLAEFVKGRAAGEAALRTYFKADTVWEMVGIGTMVGPEEAIVAMNRDYAALGIARLQVDLLSIAAEGDRVLTERVDRMIGADGGEVRAARIMGIFEIEGGRIRATREYFDTAGLLARLAHQPEAPIQ
jgi:limonene-1,2-epoxide hydrolase